MLCLYRNAASTANRSDRRRKTAAASLWGAAVFFAAHRRAWGRCRQQHTPAARAAYDALTDEQKLLVTNVSKLVDAENTPLPIDPPDPLPAPVPTGDTGIMVYLLVCVLCCMTALFAVRRRTNAE